MGLNKDMVRRKTVSVKIGDVFVGSEHPIVIQSMTLSERDVRS